MLDDEIDMSENTITYDLCDFVLDYENSCYLIDGHVGLPHHFTLLDSDVNILLQFTPQVRVS